MSPKEAEELVQELVSAVTAWRAEIGNEEHERWAREYLEKVEQKVIAALTAPSVGAVSESRPCQCANCSGYGGWFASCLGYK